MELVKGEEMTSWYDFKKLERNEQLTDVVTNKNLLNYHGTEFWESVKFASDLVKKEVKLLGDASRVYIGGFGNGASISLAT